MRLEFCFTKQQIFRRIYPSGPYCLLKELERNNSGSPQYERRAGTELAVLMLEEIKNELILRFSCRVARQCERICNVKTIYHLQAT